jgi:branched-chain amino acid transport system permease protein
MMRKRTFWILDGLVVLAVFAGSRFISNDYIFFASYLVLQYIVLATAWNILGGYTGYINFGTAGFFAIGAYSAVVLHKLWGPPIPVLIVVGGVISGVLGLGMGYLTLRLRGVFFAISTLAMAVVLQTLITNWDYVGGSRGVYIIRPASAPLIGPYIQYLCLIMLALAGIAVGIARSIEDSTLGYGLAAIRDDELAAEASGVPTLRLKLISTALSGALMGMAGAPLPYYVTYLDPDSGFNLAFAVNAIAMPLIGGTQNWIGPVIGAIVLGTIQQVATVTISSAVNLLIVGVLMVGFVVVAPNGIVGLFQAEHRLRRAAYLAWWVAILVIAGILVEAVNRAGYSTTLALLVALLAAFAHLFIAVLRLNDIGRKGWWALLLLVPAVNIVFQVYLFITASRDAAAAAADARGVPLADKRPV